MLTTRDLHLHWWGRNREVGEVGERREANGERAAPMKVNLSI
jgi:hypothetical protein